MSANGTKSHGNGGVQLANGGSSVVADVGYSRDDYRQASHNVNGLGPANGTNGASESPAVPEIPHVTANIIPLANVLKFYTQETFRQLSTMIENLSITKESESDVMRKKKFLQLIVGLRQDFVKIYTLVKWAAVSNDIGKLIDLLNWFRGQEFYFEQLSLGLNELNRFGGAKLPNSDLVTSLEILIKGRPQLPSYNLIKDKPISPEKVMQVLQDLNLLLTTRMALNDNVPVEFLNNYTVKDGRIIFHLPHKFEVSITIANDILIEAESDYHKSPYYFIDFQFLFGINHEGVYTTGISSRLPESFFAKFEKSCNQILLESNLRGLYNFLMKFCSNYKLNLLYQQLKLVTAEIKWSKSIKFKFNSNKNVITINYWNSQSFKSYIEISIDTAFAVDIRWYKNGEYFENNDVQINNEEFNIEYLLSLILNKHCEILMSKINDKFAQPFVNLINPQQLLIKLTTKKQAILCINPSSGVFFFKEPSINEIQLVKRINGFNFNGNEDLLADFVINNLVELKLQRLSKEVHNKLITIEWISNNIIKLKESELKKISDKVKNYRMQFYRCKSWPSSWFLINLISDKDYEINWFVSRIKSIKGEWRIEWSSDLNLVYSPTFDFFSNLPNICFNKIIHNMITDELARSNIQFMKLKDNTFMQKLGLDSPEDCAYDLDFCLFNANGRFIPVHNSSNCLFLKIRAVRSNTKDIKLKVRFKGKIDLSLEHFNKFDFSKLNITIDTEKNSFEVDRDLNLINFNSDVKLTNQIFNSMNQFNMLVTVINELAMNNIEIRLNANQQILFSVNDLFKDLYIELPEHNSSRKAYVLRSSDPSTRNDVKLVLEFLNQQETHSHLTGIINYLTIITPILNGVDNAKKYVTEKNKAKLANGLSKVHCDIRIRDLNSIDLLFRFNYASGGNQKTIVRDKIFLSCRFMLNKFYKEDTDNLNLLVSFFDNINQKNLKHQKLFEMIFKQTSAYDKVTSLNYDFILKPEDLKDFLALVCDSIINYTEASL